MPQQILLGVGKSAEVSDPITSLPYDQDFGALPDGPLPADVWVGPPSWAVAGGKVKNNPPGQSQLVTDGDMEAVGTAAWASVSGTPTLVEKSAAQAYAGTQSLHITTDASNEGVRQFLSVIQSRWYRYMVRVRTGDSPRARLTFSSYIRLTNASGGVSWRLLVNAINSPGTGAQQYQLWSYEAGAGDYYWDEAACDLLQNHELFAHIVTVASSVDASVEITWPSAETRSPVGLIVCLDDKNTPANYLLGFIHHHIATTYAVLYKVLNGLVAAQLISAAVTYVDGAPLRLVKNANAVDLYYNGLQVGATQTVLDAAIVSNVRHGMFSTYSGNELDRFTVEAV